ncbi:MAG: DUF423 domain-containing protein [Cyclobacteriaceae bacterium]|nr:DUF423 domain-containing protein [Cyclobacteriaceae bacterium]UYN87854.1 MAG: DUF423 domain-containing protein [Cyclobacteriaceae bacterium]
MNSRTTFTIGAALGMLGVAVGAFGAHAIKPMLIETGRVDTFELAVRYQFYHALALLVAGILQHLFRVTLFAYASRLFVAGVFLFSGSLYLLCFTQIKTFAMITPIGGVALIAGWLCLLAGIYKIR